MAGANLLEVSTYRILPCYLFQKKSAISIKLYLLLLIHVFYFRTSLRRSREVLRHSQLLWMSTWSYIDFPVRVERFMVSIKPLIEKTLSLGVDVAHWQAFSSADSNFCIFETIFFPPFQLVFYALNIHFWLIVQVRIHFFIDLCFFLN